MQQDSNKQLIQQRLNRFRLPVLLIFLIFGGRLWQLQIIQGTEYALKAERNRIRRIALLAPRGAILDRNGVPLVENRPSFNVLLYREDMKNREETIQFLIEKMGISRESLERQFNRNRNIGLYHPFIVKEDVGMEDISIVEAHRADHPEIRLGPEPRRIYNYGKLAAHILGYLGEISREELASNKYPGAIIGSLVGRSGVERQYNQTLMGRDGARQVFVDSRGREIGVSSEIDSVIGNELRLTLDLELQQVAERALEGKVGAAIAMNPNNGEILAMAGSPSFDPNMFSPRISSVNWNDLMNHPNKPMQNRAIQNSYAPGSIFKIVMASAGLHNGALTGDTAIFCPGEMDYYGHTFRCTSAHGSLHLEQAIARSCNVFFYELGRRLGISKIAEHAESLGLGLNTGVDLPEERSGVMPSPEWKQKTQKDKWYAGETISVAIGQGAVSVTPLQLVRAISAIATGGKLTTPHVFMQGATKIEWPIKQLSLKEEHVRKIRAGMWQSVNGGGTGHNAAISGADICGKTGTAQVVSKEKRQFMRSNSENHSWFAGFAGRDNPEIAVVVFVEHGGYGGVAAAPVAREIFKAYLGKKYPGLIRAAQMNPTIISDEGVEDD